MKKEKSCGAVIYKIEDDRLLFLLVCHNEGHWSFPKGHVENNETEEETALREIKEETGLDVLINTNFRYVETYSPKRNITKDVVYFVSLYLNGNVIKQESEIKEIKWLNEGECLNLITYNDDKVMFIKAINYIKSIID